MHILFIFFILLIFLLLCVWLIKQSKEKLQQVFDDIGAPFLSKPKDWVSSLKIWAENYLSTEPALQSWLLSLTSEGLQALGEKIAEFCREMAINLDWLLKPDTEIDPIVRQKAEAIVIDYCKICQKAVENQPSEKD